jgi:hypothetical protein
MPASASPAINKTQAASYARAINLRAADLPGMSITAPEGEKPNAKRVGAVERCAGNVTAQQVVANIHSPTFSGGEEPEHEQIRSVVEVMPTTVLADRNNAANRSQRSLACARRFFAQQLVTENGARVRYGTVTIKRLPDPVPGLPGGFGYRIAVAILGVPSTIEPTQPHLYVDAFGFLSGPAEIALIATGFPQPVPEDIDQRLLALLHSRADARTL